MKCSIIIHSSIPGLLESYLSDIRHARRHQLGAGELALCCLGDLSSFSFLFVLFLGLGANSHSFSLLGIPARGGWNAQTRRSLFLSRPGNPNPVNPINPSVNRFKSDFSTPAPCENRPDLTQRQDVRQRHPSGCLPSPLVAGGSTTLVGVW